MPKFRSVEQKRKLILFLLQLRPKIKERVLELTDEQILNPTVLGRIYGYEPLWNAIDAYIGKPIKEKMVCDMWNKLAEGYCNGIRRSSPST